MMKLNSKLESKLTKAYVSGITALSTLGINSPVSANAGEVQSRINEAFSTIQGVLTGLIVTVGIVVALFIVIKRMPSADDPQEKNEVYKADRKSTRLNSSHVSISYAVFCLKKKKTQK